MQYFLNIKTVDNFEICEKLNNEENIKIIRDEETGKNMDLGVIFSVVQMMRLSHILKSPIK